MDIIESLIAGAPIIIVAIISTIGGFLINRFRPQTTKVDEFKSINEAYKNLKDEHEKESEQNKKLYEQSEKRFFEYKEETQKQISDMKIDVEKMKQQIKYLSDYRKKYNKLKYWAKDVCDIAERETIDLPFLESNIIDDIKHIKKKEKEDKEMKPYKNYQEQILELGKSE